MRITLRDLQRTISSGLHCAFTSLLLWRGHLYLAYREAQSHGIFPPGKIVILRAKLPSDNAMPAWEPCATFHTGGDDRDPKLFDAGVYGIGIAWGTYYPRWPAPLQTPYVVMRSKEVDLISHIALSRNGNAWGIPYQVFRPNYWIWAVVSEETVPHGTIFYAAAYHPGDGLLDVSHSVHLLGSNDCLNWWYHGRIIPEMYGKDGLPSEPTLAFLGENEEDRRLHCLIRQEKKPLLHYVANDTYENWKPTKTHILQPCVHAPALVEIGGRWILAGRAPNFYTKTLSQGVIKSSTEASMRLWLYDMQKPATCPQELLTLPSWGDCSYPGLAWDAEHQVLWCSYYSQHAYEREIESEQIRHKPFPADVYVAKIDVEYETMLDETRHKENEWP